MASQRDYFYPNTEILAADEMRVTALGTGRPFRLAGPGLRVPEVVQIDGLPDDFSAAWARNHALFQRGFDVILCSGTRLAALPRSVRIEEG